MLETVMIDPRNLIAYENNAKIHTDSQIDHIANSIRDFGFNDPVGIWTRDDGKLEIVTGHGAVQAAIKLGLKEIPCNYLDHLSDEERRAYCHVHNQTQLETGFEFESLIADMDNLNIDWDNYGFQDYCYNDQDEEYRAFIEKFEQKKTTDDCYTPDNIYEAVANYVSQEYGVKRSDMVRPFYPGGDYQNFEYKDWCCVVDNPPFSILSEIRRFYLSNGIKYFLFCPSLTAFSSSIEDCLIGCGASITYENGAIVNTSFVTNLEDIAARSAPDLHSILKEEDDKNNGESSSMPNYKYPVEVLTSSDLNILSKYGVDLKIKRDDSCFIRALDSQKKEGKAIYGGGLLLKEKAAAEKAAAEKVAAEKSAPIIWELSDRELQLVRDMND